MNLLRNRFVVFGMAIVVFVALGTPLFGDLQSTTARVAVTLSVIVSMVVIGITTGIVFSHVGSLAYPHLAMSVAGTVAIGVVMVVSALWAADCVLPNSGVDPNLVCGGGGQMVEGLKETQTGIISD